MKAIFSLGGATVASNDSSGNIMLMTHPSQKASFRKCPVAYPEKNTQ